jgi:hypothetical protein
MSLNISPLYSHEGNLLKINAEKPEVEIIYSSLNLFA